MLHLIRIQVISFDWLAPILLYIHTHCHTTTGVQSSHALPLSTVFLDFLYTYVCIYHVLLFATNCNICTRHLCNTSHVPVCNTSYVLVCNASHIPVIISSICTYSYRHPTQVLLRLTVTLCGTKVRRTTQSIYYCVSLAC